MAGMSTVAAAMSWDGVVLSQPVVSTTPSIGIAVEKLDEAEVGEVAVERGARALAGFLDRMDGELKGDTAGLADTFAHTLSQHQVMPVAG